MRSVEGYKEGNVTFVYPEGKIRRWNLSGADGGVRVRRVPIHGLLGINGGLEYENIAAGLMLLGLIPARSWICCHLVPTEENIGEKILLIDTENDVVEYVLSLAG